MTRSFPDNGLAALVIFAAAAAAPALAVEPARPSGPGAGETRLSEPGRLIFAPDFFAAYNPQTAQDMVARIPGFSISGGGGGRGLAGNLGNVLIDGRRPSSKNGVSALLSRIPAASVERIELIGEPQPGIDMAGRDQVVNLITNRSGGWSGAWTSRLRYFESARVTPDGEISATRATADSTLTISLDLSTRANGSDQLRSALTPDAVFLGRRADRVQDSFYDLTPSLAYQREFDAGHTLRLDARAWTWRSSFNRGTQAFDAAGALAAFETGVGQTQAQGAEATLDYAHAHDALWTVKLTALQRLMTKDGDDLFTSLDAVGAFDGSVALINANSEGESILRLEARRDGDRKSAWVFAAEGAYNFLDGDLSVFEDAGSGPVEVDLPVSQTRVAEERLDLSARRIWSPAPAWSVEGAVTMELSRIAQTGDAQKERTFTYVKPELTATWSLSERDKLRFTAERAVGQLSFGDFISSVNVTDDTAQLGNPELEPERTWRIQADWERRVAQTGVVTLLVRHEWVDGVEDLVPIAGLFDSPGNLPDGRRWRVQAGFTAPLQRIGISGGELSGSAMVRQTRVEDPVTGVSRRFRGDEDWRASLDFRQDLVEAGFAWGVNYYVQGDEDFYRLEAFDRVRAPRGNLDVFAETRRFAGLTTRVGADLNLGQQERRRLTWAANRAQGAPIEQEVRTVDFDGAVYLEISGVF